MQRETKLIGWAALVLGCIGVLAGIGILAGWSALPDGRSGGCKAFCGLALLSREVLGDQAGQIVAGSLWIVAGAVVGGFGYRALSR